MNLDTLSVVATYLLTISIGTERVVELIKKFIIKDRVINKGWYLVLSTVIGGVVGGQSALISSTFHLNVPYVSALLVGLLVSAGSGFWHDVVTAINVKSKT